jgi:hypothetical protein
MSCKESLSFAMCPIDVSSANNPPKPVIPSAMSLKLWSSVPETQNCISILTLRVLSLRDVESHKHLGVIFSNDCKWTKHIDKLIEKSSKQLNVLRKHKIQVPDY